VSRRTDRIAGEIQAEIARLLREEVTDPRVGLVTLTRVDVAPDLSNALVYWSALDPDVDATDQPDEAAERIAQRQSGLESAAQFLRRRAAGVLPLRRMPALRFRYDPSLALGSHTLAVLREVAPHEAPDADLAPVATPEVDDGSEE
jgi:ribosome-binding factor A